MGKKIDSFLRTLGGILILVGLCTAAVGVFFWGGLMLFVGAVSLKASKF